MKTEVGSFSAASSTVVVLLNDSSINVKGVYFQISPISTTGESSTGFSDGTTSRAKSLLIVSTHRESRRSTVNAITHYKWENSSTTLKIAGKPSATGFNTTGEFEMTFSTYDPSISIDFMVIGD